MCIGAQTVRDFHKLQTLRRRAEATMHHTATQRNSLNPTLSARLCVDGVDATKIIALHTFIIPPNYIYNGLILFACLNRLPHRIKSL